MTARIAKELAAYARALGARDVPELSPTEDELLKESSEVKLPRSHVAQVRSAIQNGRDPLGDWFIALRSAEDRRPLGQTYTPRPIIKAMLGWAGDATTAKPKRVVDPGAGSGRFALAAARRFPKADVLANEIDPLAALICRANIAAADLSKRATVQLQDYHSLTVPPIDGATLFVGNPPYVRHHQIHQNWKRWLTDVASRRGLSGSQLAGLHVHFFLATAEKARPGDFGAFITSAEWLDVNYGALVRELLLDGLGGEAIHLLEPTVMPFAGTATTGAITCFNVGAGITSIRLKQHKALDSLDRLAGGRRVSKERLAEARRWTPLLRAVPKLPEGYIELGELCRVHRGAVTGANRVWISDQDDALPAQVLYPSVTKARELFSAGSALAGVSHLRFVIDLPTDLDVFDADERKLVDGFLKKAKKAGAADGYIARNRRAWWSVGLRDPAPILSTYMARRPPAFVRNLADARHINIAHGLYPREPIAGALLDRLADALRTSVVVAQGRTYAGGLTKFEPKEMERLPVPGPALLSQV